jgi:hypothetical protein
MFHVLYVDYLQAVGLLLMWVMMLSRIQATDDYDF